MAQRNRGGDRRHICLHNDAAVKTLKGFFQQKPNFVIFEVAVPEGHPDDGEGFSDPRGNSVWFNLLRCPSF